MDLIRTQRNRIHVGFALASFPLGSMSLKKLVLLTP